jgi:hypothetical protein
MLVVGLTVTGIATVQFRRGSLVVDSMRALVAADSGLERSLYIDFRGGGFDPAAPMTPVLSGDEAPFNTADYTYSVSKSRTCVGGTDAGQACVIAGDCGGGGTCPGGTCFVENLCVGGTLDGQQCTDDSDCLEGGTCSALAPLSCETDVECAGPPDRGPCLWSSAIFQATGRYGTVQRAAEASY